MAEKPSIDFRLIKIDETRYYLLDEIKKQWFNEWKVKEDI